MRWARAFCGGTLAVVVALSASSVRAEDQDDLIAQGIALRKQNRDQEALPLFKRAFELKATPRASGQLGTCEQALGLWVNAEVHIAEALRHSGDPWLRDSEAALKKALRFVQDRLGSIEVWGSPAGAIVRIDGEQVATLPMAASVRVPVGQRALSLEAGGFLPESRTIEVRARDSVREHFALRPSAPGPTPIAAPGASSFSAAHPVASIASSGPANAISVETPGQPPAETAPVYARWWFWAAVGVVAVAGGTSAYLLSRGPSGCTAPAGGLCATF